MKVFKIIIGTLLLGLFVTSSTNVTFAANATKNGVYSIESGKEGYYSVGEFKSLNKEQKKTLLRSKWFIVSGSTVYPIGALLMSSSELSKSGETIADFENKYKVSLAAISEGNVADDFDVVGID